MTVYEYLKSRLEILEIAKNTANGPIKKLWENHYNNLKKRIENLSVNVAGEIIRD